MTQIEEACSWLRAHGEGPFGSKRRRRPGTPHVVQLQQVWTGTRRRATGSLGRGAARSGPAAARANADRPPGGWGRDRSRSGSTSRSGGCITCSTTARYCCGRRGCCDASPDAHPGAPRARRVQCCRHRERRPRPAPASPSSATASWAPPLEGEAGAGRDAVDGVCSIGLGGAWRARISVSSTRRSQQPRHHSNTER